MTEIGKFFEGLAKEVKEGYLKAERRRFESLKAAGQTKEAMEKLRAIILFHRKQDASASVVFYELLAAQVFGMTFIPNDFVAETESGTGYSSRGGVPACTKGPAGNRLFFTPDADEAKRVQNAGGTLVVSKQPFIGWRPVYVTGDNPSLGQDGFVFAPGSFRLGTAIKTISHQD
jgi:hypothetical protein